MTHLPTAPCRYCGKPVVWADGELANGGQGRLPLDPRPPVYATTLAGSHVTATRDKGAMVLHHATCGKYQAAKEDARRDEDEVLALRREVQQLRDRVATLTAMLPSRPA